ncbi:MAG: hypothetical protein HYY16_19850 [Planctomycetes bacterium]|nr:hypothetical protein [Planctomycetota bacterium]
MDREALLTAVMTYQIERLRRDYDDFLRDPKWTVVGEFFFSRVYGCPDKKERDQAGRRIFDSARKVLGAEITGNLAKLLELNELTDRLDQRLIDKMAEMGVPKFTEEAYEQAYRLCDNYDDRRRQIDLILDGLKYFHRLAFTPGLGVALALLRPYAAIKKATLIYDFLRDGYLGFRTVRSITLFADATRDREVARLDRIYGRRTDQIIIRTGRTTRRTTRRQNP